MMKKKLFATMLASLLACSLVGFAGCGGDGGEENPPQETPGNTDDKDMSKWEVASETGAFTDASGYTYYGTETVAPYYVFDSTDESMGEYDNMFIALHEAGVGATQKDKWYVLDSNGLEIFRRASNSVCYVFDGEYYVGTTSQKNGKAWALEHERAYVVSGLGGEYVELGKDKMPNSSNENLGFEYFSGSYVYMFSNGGVMQGPEFIEHGYGYMSMYVRMSEAIYRPSADGNGWNAYVFINGRGGDNCDLGIIGSLNPATNKVVWRLVKNSSISSFSVVLEHSNTPITEMSYDSKLEAYTGADDLFFEVRLTPDSWDLQITNLRTKIKQGYHEDGVEAGARYGGLKPDRMNMLFAVSYCPVVGNIWNARCGAMLKNVVADHLQLARYREDGKYEDAVMYDFYPGEDTMNIGYAQGADNARYRYGVREADGAYKSGATYEKGDKYIAVDIQYDGKLYED